MLDQMVAPGKNSQPAEICGRVLSVSGSQASVGLPATSLDPTSVVSVTVGKFLRIQRVTGATRQDFMHFRSNRRGFRGPF